jgi:hypothetical protein
LIFNGLMNLQEGGEKGTRRSFLYRRHASKSPAAKAGGWALIEYAAQAAGNL